MRRLNSKECISWLSALIFSVLFPLLALATPTQRITGNLAVSNAVQVGLEPSPAIEGMVAYDSVSHALVIYNGTAWQKVFDASNLTGTLPAGVVPAPTTIALGGVFSSAAVANQYINAILTDGSVTRSRPACATLSDSSASCSTDATNATNISTGTLANGRTTGASTNTINTLVLRDGSGNFSTGTMTGNVNATQIGLNDISGTSAAYFKTSAIGVPTLTVKAIGSQSADMIQVLDSSNVAQMIFTGGGNFKFFHNVATPEARFDIRPSINQSSANAGNNARYSMYIGDAQALATNLGGGIAFGGPNTGATDLTEYGYIWTNKNNASSGDVGASMHFATRNNSTGLAQRALELDSSGNADFFSAVILDGSTSGKVSIKPQATAGTYNFNLPTTAGASGTVLTSAGGAGAPMTWSTALISPMTTLGDVIYEDVTPAAARLAGNITATKMYLSQTGTGSVSAAPAWAQPAFADLSGNIGVSQMNSGTSASSSTFWRGDGTWAVAGGTITGPGSSTNTAFARWNGTGGTAIQDSVFLGASTGILTTTGDTSGMTMVSTTDTTASGSLGVDHNSTSLLLKTLESSTNAGYSLGLSTASIAGANANATGGISLTTGDKSAGTGNSGGITLTTGATTGGSRGRITLTDGSEGNSPGAVWTISGNSGAGHWVSPPEKNYIANPDANILSSSTTPAGWANYSDAAGTLPVDCTGGAPSTALTRNTTTPIGPTTDFRWTKSAANRQGEGFSYDFTIDKTDQAKVMKVAFDYQVASGTFVAGTSTADSDMTVWIYDVTNAVLIQPSTYKLFSSTTSPPAGFDGSFQTASNSTSYRLCVHTGTTSASAYTLAFRNFEAKRARYVYGSPFTDPASVTMTTGGWVDANHSVTALEHREGKFAYYDVLIAITGTPTTASLTVNLPTGRTIDTAALTKSSANYGDIDNFQNTIVAAGVAYSGDVVYNNTTSVSVYVKKQDVFTGTAYTKQGAVTQAVPATFANADYIRLSFRVPIVGWSSAVQMSDSAPQTVIAMVAQQSAPTATVTSTPSLLKFTSAAINDTTGGFSTSTGLYTVTVPGFYRATAAISVAGTFTTTTSTSISIAKNGTEAQRGVHVAGGAITTDVVSVTSTAYYNSGDTISPLVSSGATSPTISSSATNNFFMIERLAGPVSIGATETVAARYYGVTATVTSSPSALSFINKDYDSNSAYSGSTYTCPVAGKYDFLGSVLVTSGSITAGQIWELYLYKNGSNTNLPIYQYVSQGTSVANPLSLPITFAGINCNAGDTIVIQISSNSTSPVITASTSSNFLAVKRVGM